MSPYAHQIYIIKPMPATYILSISMASEEAHMLGQGPFRIPLAAVRAAYTTPSSAPGTTAAVSNVELQKQNTEMKTKIKKWRNQIATIKTTSGCECRAKHCYNGSGASESTFVLNELMRIEYILQDQPLRHTHCLDGCLAGTQNVRTRSFSNSARGRATGHMRRRVRNERVSSGRLSRGDRHNIPIE
jgi:hypothetical protein